MTDHVRRLRHTPTKAQLRELARLDGRNPLSYLLDERRNWLPARVPARRGSYGLAFDYEDENGCMAEIVVLPDGSSFRLA